MQFFQKKINENNVSFLWFIIPSVLSGIIWGHISNMPHKLSFMSTVFDTAYSVSYLICFVIMGEKLTITQFFGFFVAIVGIYLMH